MAGFREGIAVLVTVFVIVPTTYASEIRNTITSWYSSKDACLYNPHPRCLMANGKSIYEQEATQPYFAASWEVPLGTVLTVCRHRKVPVENDRVQGRPCVTVEVTDRGPAKRLVAQGRRLDLSRQAFQAVCGDLRQGVCEVEIAEVRP